MRDVIKGTTSYTLKIRLFNALNGGEQIGITIADLQLKYIRILDSGEPTDSGWTTLAALAGSGSAWDDNKGIEISEGYYRVDIPNAAFATGAGQLSLLVQDSVNDIIMVESVEIQLVKDAGEIVKENSPQSWLSTG